VGEEGGLPGGIDGSANVGTFQPNGARTAFMYADQKPRINTYGDSFTHGDQVNDGETWQEYLAAHLREPIGNFGVGGYGVYQAYRRMLREEKTDHAAQYLILTICCDDMTRSLFRSWFPLTRAMVPAVFSGAKPNIEMDLRMGRFVEKENLIPTEAAMYNLTNPRWLVEHLKDDLALQLQLYGSGGWTQGKRRIRDLDRKAINKLAKLLDFPFDWSVDEKRPTVPSRYARYGDPPITPMQAQALALLNRYSQRTTIFILDRARAFAQQHGKKLLVVLVVNAGDIESLLKGGTRDNQEVLDYLVKEQFD
jgi:lysophospholipase L1-like esterase